MEYLIVKWLHILSSTVLFGTGLGSAYYMFFTSLSRQPAATAIVVRQVVWADWLFTTTTIVFQPLSGLYLAHLVGIPLTSKWIVWSFALYVLAGVCWLPVVWLQIRMRGMAQAAAQAGLPLPPQYFRMLKVWTALGVPAFLALVVVFWLMVAKPV
ncbi:MULTISPECIES: DUF2269 domain-containing protein [unclassified Roseateles]|uniref:DUF2269 family protein n=1 Tax=unclassified Roseateles TaxID=2626991 RepID=UPI0006FEA6A5|nr:MULTISPECIES: DUF2269 domain-containing protein [unclassified Roseateles]KQW43278.1 hypothetical protein ASC81_15895 [Pelomonas sp. Root405]KRA71016.1 hypothetical protein ASD88_14420 [Pelomonas sp. Root662]